MLKNAKRKTKSNDDINECPTINNVTITMHNNDKKAQPKNRRKPIPYPETKQQRENKEEREKNGEKNGEGNGKRTGKRTKK